MDTDEIFDDLFESIREKFIGAIEKLKGRKKELFSTIDEKFDVIQKKIDARIEEIKHQIDTCSNVLKEELKRFQNEYKKEKLSILDTVNYEEEYKNFPLKRAMKQAEISNEMCEKAQKELTEMQKSFDTPFEHDLNIRLRSNDFDPRCVGALCFKTNIREQIKSKNFYQAKLKVEPKCFCALPNSQLLVSGIKKDGKRCLQIYDENFKMLKCVTTLNESEIVPSFLSTDFKSRIYVSEPKNKRIIMTDLNLNFQKTYEPTKLMPSCGHSFFFNDNLYVCNYHRSKITQLDLDFNKKADFKLDRRPLSIHILDGVVLINEEYHGTYSIAFFELVNFNLMRRHEGVLGSILAHTLYFYLLSTNGKNFKIFNLNGDLVEELKVDCFHDDERKGGTIAFFNGNLIISSFKSNKLVCI